MNITFPFSNEISFHYFECKQMRPANSCLVSEQPEEPVAEKSSTEKTIPESLSLPFPSASQKDPSRVFESISVRDTFSIRFSPQIKIWYPIRIHWLAYGHYLLWIFFRRPRIECKSFQISLETLCQKVILFGIQNPTRIQQTINWRSFFVWLSTTLFYLCVTCSRPTWGALEVLRRARRTAAATTIRQNGTLNAFSVLTILLRKFMTNDFRTCI